MSLNVLKLPHLATQPFCPAEVQGSIAFDPHQSFRKKLSRFFGPALLVAVGYMDPGNWATDIEAGSRFGYALLCIVFLSSFAAIFVQLLSLRLGIVTGKDLALLSAERNNQKIRIFLWLTAELSIIACDFAEVIGGALAFHLLLGVPLLAGVVLTIFDTLIVLGLKGRNFRTLEAIVGGLIATIGICFLGELLLAPPRWSQMIADFIPSPATFLEPHALPLVVGIIGATIMPHNLYLHSSIVQTRDVKRDQKSLRQAISASSYDTYFSLFVALLINCAILILAADTFHARSEIVAEIDDAYHLLTPLVGSSWAAPLFGIALLASGQSSTVTGTVAGQVILDGFMKMKIPCWQRRMITRGLALIPAFIGIALLGEHGVGKMLVISQIILSLQLPFALAPLIRQVSDKKLMGKFRIRLLWKTIAWSVFALILGSDLLLLSDL